MPSATCSSASATRAGQLLSRLVEGQAFPSAFQEATGVTLVAFEGDLARRLSAVAAANELPGAARSGGGVPAPGVR